MLSSAQPVAPVGRIPFRVTRLDDAVSSTITAAIDPTSPGEALRFANAYSVASARRDAGYAALLRSGGINLPDGAPVAWALRRCGNGAARRVRGPSFFDETIRRGTEVGLRHYFFGTNDDVLALLVERLKKDVPGVTIVGTFAPDYRSDPDELAGQLPAEVTRATVDIVWVGLGSPKQDFVVARIVADRGVTAAGVGAAFDFAAGTVPQAPRLVQRAGLEWMFRLVSEPRRLWRRYLIGNTVFLGILMRQLLIRRSPAAPATRSTTVSPRIRTESVQEPVSSLEELLTPARRA